MFQVERRGDVAVLRMDDGKVNVFNPNFVARFAKTWRQVESDGKAVVLVGNDRAFSAGLDLKMIPTLPQDRLVTFARDFLDIFRDVLAYARPVVAAVDGPAIAGGAVMALSADFRLATPRARLGLTEVPVGIPFPKPVLELARARLSREEHAPALLRGVVREGEQCLAGGWAHRVVPRESLVDEAVALAQELSQMSPLAYAHAKADLQETVLHAFAAWEKRGAVEWAESIQHPDSRAALARTLDRLAKKA